MMTQLRVGEEGQMSEQGTGDSPGAATRPRLFDVVRETIRRRHYSYRTEKTYLHWIKRFILFSGRRHPRELGASEVTAFLNEFVARRHVAAAIQNQALAALLFLYKEVLAQPLPWLDALEHAKQPIRRPTCVHHHDLYPRAEQRRARREKPAR
jgi:hypothetical protein